MYIHRSIPFSIPPFHSIFHSTVPFHIPFQRLETPVKLYSNFGLLGFGLPGHLTASISPARVESSMSRKTSTRVVQVTGFLPLPVSHSWRISVLMCSELLFWWAMILTVDPFWSSRRKVPNWTYLVAISTGTLTTLPSVHLNLSSSGRVGSVPGLYVVC